MDFTKYTPASKGSVSIGMPTLNRTYTYPTGWVNNWVYPDASTIASQYAQAKQYVQAMLNQDSVALSKLFSPTAIFVDYCPKDAGQPQLHAYGPEGIDMFFRNRFLFRRFEITDPLIVSDTQAYYYAVYNGYHIRAVATIQDFSEDGEIQRLVVRPA